MPMFAPAASAADIAPLMDPVPQAANDTPEALSPWQIRVRGLGVVTHDSGFVDGAAGSGLSYSDSVIPELDISYYLTDNIAAELILGTTPHTARGKGAIAGLGTLGKAWLLPPTLMLQYHFTDLGAFKPYVGVGPSYFIFIDEKPGYYGFAGDRERLTGPEVMAKFGVGES